LLSLNRLGKYGCDREGEGGEGNPKVLHDGSVLRSTTDHQRVIGILDYQRVLMGKKLPNQPQIQLLVNAAMRWAEAELRESGSLRAAAAWLATGASEPEFRTIGQSQSPGQLSIQDQEAMLTAELKLRWQRGELAAAVFIAPVLYGRNGSAERSLAVRLHAETHDGYCADILMPYRIRIGWRWRGSSRNRVHFSHPVAQESDSRLSDSAVSA
jgi:hypothetical protein